MDVPKIRIPNYFIVPLPKNLFRVGQEFFHEGDLEEEYLIPSYCFILFKLIIQDKSFCVAKTLAAALPELRLTSDFGTEPPASTHSFECFFVPHINW